MFLKGGFCRRLYSEKKKVEEPQKIAPVYCPASAKGGRNYRRGGLATGATMRSTRASEEETRRKGQRGLLLADVMWGRKKRRGG